jgi:hypothetical protein
MKLRILFAVLLLAQAFGVASVMDSEPIPICFPCPDAR